MRLTFLVLSTAIVPAVFACGGTTEPAGEIVLTMRNVAGIYYGVTFTTEENGVVTDQIWRGATIELLLSAVGSSGGRLFIPADTTGGADVDVNLVGTWELNGNIVTLSQSNDTFLNNMNLVFKDTNLSGEATRDGTIYRVVLAW